MKYYYALIIAIAICYLLIQIFNHVDPWIAILLLVVIIGFIIKFIINKTKNK